MENLIRQHKPRTIFDIIPKSFFEIDLGHRQHDEYLLSKNCYEWYYAFGKYFNPRSVLEIGVRRGYSLVSLLAGCEPGVFAEGWDIPNPSNRNYVKDCLNGLDERIKEHCNAEIDLKYNNSQHVKSLSRKYDLVHIDGAHQHKEKIHDLELCLGMSDVIVVDDYKCPVVGGATNLFVRQHRSHFSDVFKINSLRGTLIIKQK